VTWRGVVGAAGAYLLLTALFVHRLIPRLGTHILADDGFLRPGQSDAFNFLWNAWWVQKALGSGGNPFFCDWVLPPTGLNLFYDTHLLVPTVAAWPFAAVFGATAGYNLMALGLLAAGATVYFAFLRRTLDLGTPAAFLGGAFFGLSPYFVFKAHAHLNMTGAAFWGAAIAVFLHAYLKNRHTGKQGGLLALCLLLTFWNSLVEFFMTGICLAALTIVLETARRDGAGARLRRLAFALPALGAVAASVLVFAAGNVEGFSPETYSALSLRGLFSPTILSPLFPLAPSATPEFWGTVFPMAALLPLGLGAWRPFPGRGPVLIAAGVLLALTLDLGGVSSAVLRRLPFAEGFRVFARFFPFFLFFAGILVARGLRRPRSVAAVTLTAALTLLAVAEIVPWRHHASPVRGSGWTAREFAGVDRTRGVLLMPNGPYLTVHDTYQVNLDMPCVLTSNVAHRSAADDGVRRERFPILYDPAIRGDAARFLEELRGLNVGYVLFETRAQYDAWPAPGEVRSLSGGEVLWTLPAR
jgi:hypothetical protein